MSMRSGRALALCAVVLMWASAGAAARGRGAGGWHVVRTGSPGTVFVDTACADAQHCFAVYRGRGAPGILASANGGSSWRRQRIPGGVSYLASIACSSAADCVAAGYRGQLPSTTGVALGTTDGGNTWAKLALPDGITQLFVVSCASDGSCTALGSARSTAPPPSCGPGCVLPPMPGAVAPVTLVSVSAAAPGAAWTERQVVSNSLPGAQFNAISCAAGGACQAAGFLFTNCNRGTCRPAGALAGADSLTSGWRSEPVPVRTFNLYGVSCPAAGNCWVTGSTGNDVQGRGVILHTTDGGLHWARQAPPPGSNSITSIACATLSDCTAVGGLGRAGNVVPDIVTSTNGGRHWRAARAPGGLSQVVEISCSAPHRCLATGLRGFGRGNRGVILRGG